MAINLYNMKHVISDRIQMDVDVPRGDQNTFTHDSSENPLLHDFGGQSWKANF